MSITKVSSLDSISIAMSEIFKKKADENLQRQNQNLQEYYNKPANEAIEDEQAGAYMIADQHIHSGGSGAKYKSAMNKLRQANENGNQMANAILRAFSGYGDKNKTLYLREPQIGLDEGEALAIVESLTTKGFKNLDWKTQTYEDNPYKKSELKQTNMKQAQNYVASARKKIEEAARGDDGFVSAKHVLAALTGTADKSYPINLKDPMLGLIEQEVYAIAGMLNEKGYKTPLSLNYKAQGDDLQKAMREAVKTPSSNDNPYVDDNPYLDDSGDFPRSDLTEIGNPSGYVRPTAGPAPDISGPEINTTSSIILDTIEKIANTLDEASFHHSAKVADDLLLVFAKEAIKKNRS